MFDKLLYWRRRKQGLRGQEPVNTVVGHHDKPDWPAKPVTKKALLKNSKRARKHGGVIGMVFDGSKLPPA